MYLLTMAAVQLTRHLKDVTCENRGLIFLQLGMVSCMHVLNTLMFLLPLKWVNTEWKQVAADRHELQSILNF